MESEIKRENGGYMVISLGELKDLIKGVKRTRGNKAKDSCTISLKLRFSKKQYDNDKKEIQVNIREVF